MTQVENRVVPSLTRVRTHESRVHLAAKEIGLKFIRREDVVRIREDMTALARLQVLSGPLSILASNLMATSPLENSASATSASQRGLMTSIASLTYALATDASERLSQLLEDVGNDYELVLGLLGGHLPDGEPIDKRTDPETIRRQHLEVSAPPDDPVGESQAAVKVYLGSRQEILLLVALAVLKENAVASEVQQLQNCMRGIAAISDPEGLQREATDVCLWARSVAAALRVLAEAAADEFERGADLKTELLELGRVVEKCATDIERAAHECSRGADAASHA